MQGKLDLQKACLADSNVLSTSVTLDNEVEVLKLCAETLHDMQLSLEAVSPHQPGGSGESANPWRMDITCTRLLSRQGLPV